MLSWMEVLEQAKVQARNSEPWRPPLERLHGKIGDDGIERITTQAVFDILEVPQRSRGAGAGRRLAKLMTELGWTAVRVRGLTRGGYREQVRGYCRDAREGLDPNVREGDTTIAREARQREALAAARAENANLSAIDYLLQVLCDPTTPPGRRAKVAIFVAPYLEYRMRVNRSRGRAK